MVRIAEGQVNLIEGDTLWDHKKPAFRRVGCQALRDWRLRSFESR